MSPIFIMAPGLDCDRPLPGVQEAAGEGTSSRTACHCSYASCHLSSGQCSREGDRLEEMSGVQDAAAYQGMCRSTLYH